MFYPTVRFNHLNIKLALGHKMLSVQYVNCGYFYESIIEHRHSNRSYELHYIPTGKGTLIAEGQQYEIKPGCLFMTGPDIAHEQITDLLDPMAEFCICFEEQPPAAGKNTAPASGREEDLTAIAEAFLEKSFWFGEDTQQMLPLFQQLFEEAEQQAVGYYAAIHSIMEQILIRLIRNYKQGEPSRLSAPTKTLDDSRIAIIEQQFLASPIDLTIQELAGKLGLSVRQTERSIRQLYGMSFTNKKNQARMSVAARLLKSTTLPIAAIAEQTGFATLEYFCTIFKKQYGLTATAYRKSPIFRG